MENTTLTSKKGKTPIYSRLQEEECLVIDFSSLPDHEKIRIVQKGVTKKLLEAIKNIYELNYPVLAECLNITDRTIHLKKGNDKFSAVVADKAFAIIDLFSYGIELFGSKDLFLGWMNAPNLILGYTRIELLSSYVGISCIQTELKKVRYGAL